MTRAGAIRKAPIRRTRRSEIHRTTRIARRSRYIHGVRYCRHAHVTLPLESVLQPRERRVLGAATASDRARGRHWHTRRHRHGRHRVEQPIRDWITSAVYILVGVIVCWRAIRTTESRTWMVFAFGVSVYGLGNVLWAAWVEHLPNPPIPSICDAMWLTLYPCCYIGILGLARVRGRRVPARIWLDGVDRRARGRRRSALRSWCARCSRRCRATPPLSSPRWPIRLRPRACGLGRGRARAARLAP